MPDPNRPDAPLFPLWLLKYLPNMAAAHISMAYNCQGPNNTVVTACVAGTQAVGEGYRLVSRGDADVMLCGGADSRIDPLMLLAYTALGDMYKDGLLTSRAVAMYRRVLELDPDNHHAQAALRELEGPDPGSGGLLKKIFKKN